MPPLIKRAKSDSQEDIKSFIEQHDKSSNDEQLTKGPIGTCEAPHPMDRIVWRNVAIMGYLHALGLYGIYLCFTTAQWKTIIAGKSPVTLCHHHLIQSPRVKRGKPFWCTSSLIPIIREGHSHPKVKLTPLSKCIDRLCASQRKPFLCHQLNRAIETSVTLLHKCHLDVSLANNGNKFSLLLHYSWLMLSSGIKSCYFCLTN